MPTHAPAYRSSLRSLIAASVLLGAVIAFRIFPRPPNVEPVMTAALPFARMHGWILGAVFSSLSLLLYDAALGQFGVWSFFTAGAYAVVGGIAGLALSQRKHVSRWQYAGVAVVLTLFYDAVTAYTFGTYMGYALPVIIAGQIPFTLLHLASNLVGAVVLCPFIEKHVLAQPASSLPLVRSTLSRARALLDIRV